MDGIYFVLRTGCQWKALDETTICPASTAHDRFQEGVFWRFWLAQALKRKAGQRCGAGSWNAPTAG